MKINRLKKTNNRHQNKVFRDAVSKISHDLGRELTDTEKDRLHREVSKEGFDYHEIAQIGDGMFR
jgi:hypothetical protein